MKIKILYSFRLFLGCTFCFAISNVNADPLNASIDTPTSDQIIAKDSSVSFSGSATGGCPPYTYSWSFVSADPSSSTSSSASATFGDNCAGEVTTVTFTVTDASGNTDSDNVDIIVPEIESQTKVHAPDGTDDSRDTIGIAEQVTLQIYPQSLTENVHWNCTGGSGRIGNGSALENILTAGDFAETDVVTAIVGGVTLSNSFSVIEPTTITGSKLNNTLIQPGSTGMNILLTVNPLNVSFGNVLIAEQKCSPSHPTGIFLYHKAPDHVVDGSYSVLDNNNNFDHDTAYLILTGPYQSGGSFEWHIPTFYVTAHALSSGKTGHYFDNSPIVQSFTVDYLGNITIVKYACKAP